MSLIDAPRSRMAFSNLWSPMMQGTQNVLGSLHFSGIEEHIYLSRLTHFYTC